jgi:transcriptional regulator with XRE-family HTH domain
MSSGADLGLAILLFREMMGMKQGELAKAAGVSDKTISSWKRISRNPSRKLVVKVVAALGLTLTAIEHLAADIAKHRQRWLRGIGAESPRAGEEARPLQLLSQEELYLEFGHAHARLEAISAELRARKELPELGPALRTPDPPSHNP